MAGFVEVLLRRAPSRIDARLSARVLALAGDIAARHRARATDALAAPYLRAAAAVLAAYRLLSDVLPAAELGALLRDSWQGGVPGELGAPSWFDVADPLGEIAASSRWRGLVAMVLCISGLSRPYFWAVERSIRRSCVSDLFAAEGVPELAHLLHVAGGDGCRYAAGRCRRDGD